MSPPDDAIKHNNNAADATTHEQDGHMNAAAEATPNPILAAALALAEKGVPVFPCCPRNKKPLTTNGFKDASTNPGTIRTWWCGHPNAMIGMPTGKITGVFALDVDPDDDPSRDGEASLMRLVEQEGPLPETALQITPR
jgi:hypothetical protein